MQKKIELSSRKTKVNVGQNELKPLAKKEVTKVSLVLTNNSFQLTMLK